MTGPVPLHGARAALDHAAALARAEQVFVAAHPSVAAAGVALRAADAALRSYVDDVLRAGRPGSSRAAADLLRRSFTEHLAERLPDDPDGALRAVVVAAAVVAALDLSFGEWLAAGALKDGADACRARLAAVAPLLPPVG